MTRFVGIVSAKGGVGKTTTTINLASALSFLRRDTIALDANFANPDLGIHLGMAQQEKTLHSALKEEHHIKESIYLHPSGIRIVPGSLSYREALESRRENLMDVIYGLKGLTEAVIIDSTPGMGRDAQAVIKASDYVIIVTTPDIVSVTDSLKMIKLSEQLGKQVLGVIVNKSRGEGFEMDERNISDFLGKGILGIVPSSGTIRKSLRDNKPIVATDPNSPASVSYKKIAGQLIGECYVEHLEEREQRSLFSQILKNLGFSRKD